jgi:Family of unknown function (DUF6356)
MTDQTKSPAKSLKETFVSLMTSHPREAGETYWQHFRFTINMAWRLGSCSILLVGHGILPFTLTHAASDRIKACNRILADRAARTGFHEIEGGFGI